MHNTNKRYSPQQLRGAYTNSVKVKTENDTVCLISAMEEGAVTVAVSFSVF